MKRNSKGDCEAVEPRSLSIGEDEGVLDDLVGSCVDDEVLRSLHHKRRNEKMKSRKEREKSHQTQDVVFSMVRSDQIYERCKSLKNRFQP